MVEEEDQDKEDFEWHHNWSTKNKKKQEGTNQFDNKSKNDNIIWNLVTTKTNEKVVAVKIKQEMWEESGNLYDILWEKTFEEEKTDMIFDISMNIELTNKKWDDVENKKISSTTNKWSRILKMLFQTIEQINAELNVYIPTRIQYQVLAMNVK